MALWVMAEEREGVWRPRLYFRTRLGVLRATRRWRRRHPWRTYAPFRVTAAG